MYLLCICHSPHDYIRPGFTNNCNNLSSESHTWPACDTKQLLKFRSTKTWKQTHSKVSCFVSSSVQNSFHFLHSSGCFYWLTAIHAQLKHFHNCSSNQHPWLPDASEKSNQRSQTGGVHMSLSLTLLSTNSLNTKFHCAFSAMTVPISLSQHSSTYTARQTTMLQASTSRLPVSANIRQAPLLLHTTEPQVFNYSRLISQMWQLNQGHWQSKLDPPGSHAKISLSISRHDARLSSTTHCALRASRIKLTNLSRCNSFLQYFSSMDLCSTLPSSPFPF